MRTIFVVLVALSGTCLSTEACWAESPTAHQLVQQIVDAAGGNENLLKRFTVDEKLNVSSDPDKPGRDRVSVFDGHEDWWFKIGKGDWKKKKNEPATNLVWAWTLQAFVDEKSQLEVLPEMIDDEQTLAGIRISESIKPAMDVYFDTDDLRLLRIDWRKDIIRFSEWTEHEGTRYPAHCIGYRKATGKPWFVSQINALRRLESLPSELE